MKSLRRAMSYLRPYLGITFTAFVSLLLVSAINLVTPQILRYAIDNGILRQDMGVIAVAMGVLLGITILRGVFSFVQGYYSEKASQHMAYDLRNVIFNKITELSFSYHDQAQTGQLMTRVTSDVEVIRGFIGQGLVQLIGSILILIAAAVVLFIMNWRLALVEILSIPVIFVVITYFIQRVRPLFEVVQKRLSALNTILQENLAGIRVVRAFVREPYESKRYTAVNEELVNVNIEVAKRMSLSFPLIFWIASMTGMVVVLVGGLEVIGGRMSIGELVAFNSYLFVLIMPIFTFGFLAAFVSRAIVSAERVFEVLDAASEVAEKPDALTLPPVHGRVEFKGVSFRFAGAERNTLDGISFSAEPGQTIAIMGKTGSGKSSIINLIPRFYDPQQGQVLIDGYDVRDLTLDSLRGAIGIVLQDTILFSGSIRDNIAYGRPDATMDDVIAAAKAAQAHDFISEFPQGYDTVVGERGVGLSGGQKQRIAIARALLLNPRILILDDSTSSVDAETEYQLQRALDELMQGRTSFVIAQRISTVRNADPILLLDNGKIVASGKHDDLLRDSPLYGEVVDSQLNPESSGEGLKV